MCIVFKLLTITIDFLLQPFLSGSHWLLLFSNHTTITFPSGNCSYYGDCGNCLLPLKLFPPVILQEYSFSFLNNNAASHFLLPKFGKAVLTCNGTLDWTSRSASRISYYCSVPPLTVATVKFTYFSILIDCCT